jgi:alkaline phosphatase
MDCMIARPVLLLLLVLASNAIAGNAIFFHPDGAGLSHWQAARFYLVGPDGDLNWDRLPHIAVYRGHMTNSLSASSNGGATTHAYGVKAPYESFGIVPESDKTSILREAQSKGVRTGLVNSGSIIEPGTACFVAKVPARDNYAEIAVQVVESGVDVILSGGEEWMLPKGTPGRHVKDGLREDGRNLVAEALSKGYRVVYNREELAAVPDGTPRLLGVFAAQDTFNDMGPAEQKAAGLPAFSPDAPTISEMMAAALRLLAPGPFLLIAEEEGADNFGNHNNAPGVLEALRRADEAFGTALAFVESHPDTLLLTAADSAAGAMDVLGFPAKPSLLEKASRGVDANGAPYGLDENGKPFLSRPDRSGVSHPFVITWGTLSDTSGGILVRATGLGAERVRGTCDNSDIPGFLRNALFAPADSTPDDGD